jgi:hypothetical protein
VRAARVLVSARRWRLQAYIRENLAHPVSKHKRHWRYALYVPPQDYLLLTGQPLPSPGYAADGCLWTYYLPIMAFLRGRMGAGGRERRTLVSAKDVLTSS